MPKSNKGKYVSRSTYQRVVEENKRLLRDIRILTGELTPERVMLSIKWSDKFEKDRDFNTALIDVFKEVKKNNR